MTSARRSTSLFSRSLGLVECSFAEGALGKAMKAMTVAPASFRRAASFDVTQSLVIVDYALRNRFCKPGSHEKTQRQPFIPAAQQLENTPR